MQMELLNSAIEKNQGGTTKKKKEKFEGEDSTPIVHNRNLLAKGASPCAGRTSSSVGVPASAANDPNPPRNRTASLSGFAKNGLGSGRGRTLGSTTPSSMTRKLGGAINR